MKKVGFTLVELLAVIAILAILVIIALPNVIGLFKSAQKGSFESEVKTILRTAEQEWIINGMFSADEKVYSSCSDCTGPKLSISGRSNIDYYVKVNRNGKVIKLYVTDGTYQYKYSGGGLEIGSISGIQEVSDLTDDEKVVIADIGADEGYLYYNGSPYLIVGESLPSGTTTYSSYEDIVEADGFNFFLRFKLVNNVVVDPQLGYLINGNPNYLGIDTFSSNKSKLKSVFGSSNCTEGSVASANYINCEDSNSPSTIYDNGFHIRVYTSTNEWYQAGESFDDGAVCYMEKENGKYKFRCGL